MTAPTEGEIRESIRLRTELWPSDNPRRKLEEAIAAYGDFMYSPVHDVFGPADEQRDDPEKGEPGDLWADLRPSEAGVLDQLYNDAIEEARLACEVAIADVLTAAALRFGELHPHAPRATVPVVDVGGLRANSPATSKA